MNSALILLIIFSLCGVLFYFVGCISAGWHNNIILETTIPKGEDQNPKVKAVTKLYKKRLLQTHAGFILLYLFLFFWQNENEIIITYLILLMFQIMMTCLLQIWGIRKMHAVKQEESWFIGEKHEIIMDTKLVLEKNQDLVPFKWLLLIFVISLLTSILAYFPARRMADVIPLGALTLLIFIISFFTYLLVKKMPAKVLSEDKKVNQYCINVTRKTWSKFILALDVFLYLIILFNLALFWGIAHAVVLVNSGILVLTGFLLLYIFYIFLKMLHQRDTALASTKEVFFADDDYFWRYGIYMNPEDPRIMVPDRVGMNISVNIGRPLGKMIMSATVIMLFTIIILCIIPLAQSGNPEAFELDLGNNTLELNAPLTSSTTLDYSKIKKIVLLDSVPDMNMRINGAATDSISTGYFLNKKNEKVKLFVWNHSKKVIAIYTNKMTFYYSNQSDMKIKQKYQELKESVNKKVN